MVIVTLMISCHSKKPVSLDNNELSSLILDHENWKLERQNNLSQPYGWLSLVGLSWLKKGENLMGSGSMCNIKLDNKYPELLGRIYLNDSIFFETINNESVLNNGEKFDSGSLVSDANPPYTVLTHGSLSWYIVHRNNKYGVRIRDSLAETRMNFTGLEYFPFSESMVMEVEVEVTSSDTVNIMNVLGMESKNPVAAYLRFSHDNKNYKLAALDGGPLNYFLIFSDNTTGFSTYGGGRYISVQRPVDEENKTKIDFNRAYNPPCVFTDFATCPLPPKSNHLFFEVQAGEKKFHD